MAGSGLGRWSMDQPDTEELHTQTGQVAVNKICGHPPHMSPATVPSPLIVSDLLARQLYTGAGLQVSTLYSIL